jgi:hypothetical protein
VRVARNDREPIGIGAPTGRALAHATLVSRRRTTHTACLLEISASEPDAISDRHPRWVAPLLSDDAAPAMPRSQPTYCEQLSAFGEAVSGHDALRTPIRDRDSRLQRT